MMKARVIPFALLAPILALLLPSCSPRIGWGVVLWSGNEMGEEPLHGSLELEPAEGEFLPGDTGDGGSDGDLPLAAPSSDAAPAVLSDSGLRAGQVVPVYLKSNIQKVFVVGVPGTRRKADISQWRLRFFSSKSKAQEFLKEFEPWVKSFALAGRDGLPVREKADNNAIRVYRLRAGELMKVIMKVEGREVMSGGKRLSGDWYQVLTKDGTLGYSYSNTLKIFDASAEGLSEAMADASAGEPDEALDAFMLQTWRPEGFRSMIDSGRFDLSVFQTRYGLFPDPAARAIRIELPEFTGSFSWKEAVKMSSSRWAFDGSPLQIELRGQDVALATFPNDSGMSMSRFFVLISEDIDELSAAEEARRQAILESILAYGSACVSEDYGSISLSPSRRFIWIDHEAWSPLPIHDEAGDEGTIEFDVYLHPSVAESWDGVISFRFDGARKKPARFYWTAGADGLWLEPLPIDGLDASGLVAVKRAPRPQQGRFSWLAE